jgi:hypothetical protein
MNERERAWVGAEGAGGSGSDVSEDADEGVATDAGTVSIECDE